MTGEALKKLELTIDQLRILVDVGSGPIPGTIVLNKTQLAEWAERLEWIKAEAAA